MAAIDSLLVHLKDSGGSDLHLAAGQPPRMRAKGKVVVIEGQPELTPDSLATMLQEITKPDHWAGFLSERDLDFAYGLEGVARFRANYFWQHNGPGAVLRIIPEDILTVEQLNLPEVVRTFAHLNQGLVLVTGPTGSGKSTTLAAIIDLINTTYAKHIVTIEDPIEFVHPNKRSIFSQREVGEHARDFAAAVRAATREDADVILVGEMRDLETISMALTAAEMGVLVFGTLHTNNAAKTIDRLVDAFPAEQQAQVRLGIANSLAGIVAQLLLPTADGKGRCAVNEILVRTGGIANSIREGNNAMLLNAIASGRQLGMQTMDDALEGFVRQGRIRVEDAFQKANDKERFEKMMKQMREAANQP